MNGSGLATFREVARNLLRIGAGLLFMQHGVQKLFGWLGGLGGTGEAAAFGSLFWFAGVIEVFGGLAIVLGLFTQIVAAVAAVEMLVAYASQHLPRGIWPIQNMGELALLYFLIFLFLVAYGAGAFSLDARFGRRRGPRPMSWSGR